VKDQQKDAKGTGNATPQPAKTVEPVNPLLKVLGLEKGLPSDAAEAREAMDSIRGLANELLKLGQKIMDPFKGAGDKMRNVHIPKAQAFGDEIGLENVIGYLQTTRTSRSIGKGWMHPSGTKVRLAIANKTNFDESEVIELVQKRATKFVMEAIDVDGLMLATGTQRTATVDLPFQFVSKDGDKFDFSAVLTFEPNPEPAHKE